MKDPTVLSLRFSVLEVSGMSVEGIDTAALPSQKVRFQWIRSGSRSILF